MVTRKLGILGIGIQASQFRVCRQIRDQKFSSAILGVSGLVLHPFRQKWGSWPCEWVSGNSHQSRHLTGTACFVMYIVCVVVCTASLKEKVCIVHPSLCLSHANISETK